MSQYLQQNCIVFGCDICSIKFGYEGSESFQKIRAEITILLLDHGTIINQIELDIRSFSILESVLPVAIYDGISPHRAVEYNDTKSVRSLNQKGAGRTIKELREMIPLEVAEKDQKHGNNRQ